MPAKDKTLSGKEEEFLRFPAFYRGLALTRGDIQRVIEAYLDDLSYEEATVLHRHRALMDEREARAASADRDLEE